MARDDADDIEQLTRRVAQWIGLSMKLKRGNESMKVMNDTGLTMAQIAALHVLAYEGPQSITEMCERLSMSTSATSHLVQRLVEQGLFVREEAEHDRRQKVISLSAQGRKLMERLMKARYRELRASVEQLTPETRETLLRALDRVVTELGGNPAAPTASMGGSEET